MKRKGSPARRGNAEISLFRALNERMVKTMEDTQNTSIEGTQTSTEGAQNERTFTQDDVNRIVQERVAKLKDKSNEEVTKRMAELDKRERRMNAVDKLRENGLPDYLVDALNMETDEAFQQSMEAILKMKGENPNSQQTASDTIIGKGNPIGAVVNHNHADVRAAFGLR